MDQAKLNQWIAIIAQSKIVTMMKNLKKYKDSLNNAESNQVQPLKTKYNNRLVEQHKQIYEILKQMTDSVVLPSDKEEDEVILIPDQLRSETYLNLGEYEYFIDKYDMAYEYAEKSFNLYRNQKAMYYMALSHENIKIKTGAFLGKKGKVAQEEKGQQTATLFLDTIKMDPFSEYGIDSGEKLINKYNHEFKVDEVFI